MSTYYQHTAKLHERRHAQRSEWIFRCPGCKALHRFSVSPPFSSRREYWEFDGRINAPTFTPSLRSGDHCHLSLANGVIFFYADSKHALAGQRVPMEAI